MDVQVYDYEKYSLKPDIRVGNYYFQWDANGLGIDISETQHFKNFVRKIIPVLEQYMMLLQKEGIENGVDKNDPFSDKKRICIKERYNKTISFLMFIDSQGSTVFFREESCSIANRSKHARDYGIESVNPGNINSSSKNHGTISIELKWLLGELLFDRNKQDNNNNKRNPIR